MPSPCINVCAVEDERCVACGRTRAEIASWGAMTTAEQRAWMDEHAAADDGTTNPTETDLETTSDDAV